jgi:hypothetical protein
MFVCNEGKIRVKNEGRPSFVQCDKYDKAIIQGSCIQKSKVHVCVCGPCCLHKCSKLQHTTYIARVCVSALVHPRCKIEVALHPFVPKVCVHSDAASHYEFVAIPSLFAYHLHKFVINIVCYSW